MTQGPDNPNFPFVTVIMPVHNEEDFISRSLGSVLRQDYPSDRMEVLVVDGMSTDTTRAIIQTLRSDGKLARLIDNPGKIVPIGLNIAFHQAKGEIIARVDGHCEVSPDYIRLCVKAIKQYKVDGVGSPIITEGNTWLSRGIAIAMSSPFGVGDSTFRTVQDKTMLVDTIPFPVYTRSIMECAGLYDEEMIRNQDDEYNYRLRKLGANLYLISDLHSKYFNRSNIRSLWCQYYGYGFWKVRVMQKHPRQMRIRQFIPLIFVVALIISGVAAVIIPAARISFGLIIAVYLLATVVASLMTSARRGWIYLPLLPLVYAILHFSYGLGFLAGLVKFANRWER